MIFASYPFVLFFLPAVIAGCLLLRRAGRDAVMAWLTAASVFFYAWWDWRFLWVLGASIAVNYLVGRLIAGARDRPAGSLAWLVAGIAFNLGFLGWFKYVGFFAESAGLAVGDALPWWQVVLPLGISFFTFQQIAYLVDLRRGDVERHRARDYLLFVCFFPQLIAGPIVHHREMMPQFTHGMAGRLLAAPFAQGLAIFVLGLAKKVLIADQVALYVAPVFAASAAGEPVALIEAWGGALAYTFQIYFDFSAYSDMAVGLGLMFGVRLPVNFNSPYKATGIIEFWRRWHITLSRFLRDYLYIPLGGNRKGRARRHVNLMIVMLLGGLWHGAGWTFVVWGGLHGLGLVANHGWRRLTGRDRPATALGRMLCVLLTFLFLVVTWVFFRAETLASAANLLAGMAGLNGVILPDTYAGYLGPAAAWLSEAGVRFETVYLYAGREQVLWLAGLALVCWLLPNTLQWAGYRADPEMPSAVTPITGPLAWRPAVSWALGLSALTACCLVFMARVGEFLYFQF